MDVAILVLVLFMLKRGFVIFIILKILLVVNILVAAPLAPRRGRTDIA